MDTNNIRIITLTLVVVVIGYFIVTNTGNNDTAIDSEHHEDEMTESYEIYPGDVVDKINNNENIILLDVRTLEEYKQVHLRNAILLPVQELSQQSLSQIGLGEDARDKEIIIYCRSGGRSKTAYDIMSSLGYTNIKSIAGGMVHWEEDNYPFTEDGEYMGSSMMMGGHDREVSAGPRIALDRTFHDFGVVKQYGGVVKTTFTVKNNGVGTLVVGDITTSCSCTSAEISQAEIPVGVEATLTVYFDPNFHDEPLNVFKRTVFIPTNDSTVPEAEVVIQVDIDEGK